MDATILRPAAKTSRHLPTPLPIRQRKLNWKESAEGLPEFVDAIKEGNSFDLDTDFVVRCPRLPSASTPDGSIACAQELVDRLLRYSVVATGKPATAEQTRGHVATQRALVDP
jgi:hypothetical protein